MTIPAASTEDQQPSQSPFQPSNAALAAAYAAAMARIRTNMAEFIKRMFHRTGSWREQDAAAFARLVPRTVLGAQATVASITEAYLNRLTNELTGTSRPPVGVPPAEVTGSAVRNGVDPEVVYRRPYTQVWTDLAAGTPLDEAVQAGERRALTIVNTDLQLAKTHTAQKVGVKDDRFTYYRRVPQGPYTCALCLIVSTRRFLKEELAPLHPNCDCDIEVVRTDRDPGVVLDRDFLDAVHDAIERDLGAKYVAPSGKKGSTKARELHYRDIVIVHDHGEIGRVLGVRGQSFKGPDDIPRFSKRRKIKDQLPG